jgi:peptidoglycan/LPS O-acetylase OafA/YrhL
MSDAGNRAHRFLVLDSLRGVCACLVAFGHFSSPSHIWHLPFLHSTYLFVDFFFVLSGFVIAASYGEKLANGYSIAKFMALRLGRVYPLHAFMLIVMALLGLVTLYLPLGLSRSPFDEGHTGISLLNSFLLVHIFFGEDRPYWNAVSWSIAAEVWAYLTFAILFRFTKRWVVPAALVVAAGGALWALHVTPRSMNLLHDGAFARCLYGFGLGVVTYHLYARLRQARPLQSPAVAAGLELLLVLASGWMSSLPLADRRSFLAPLVFVAVVLCFAFERGIVSRLLKLRPFVLIGALSYSIYMVHHFIQLRTLNVLQMLAKVSRGRVNLIQGEQLGTTPLEGDVMVLALMAVSIGVAWVCYRFIEHPMRNWSRWQVLGQHARPAAILIEREAPTF